MKWWPWLVVAAIAVGVSLIDPHIMLWFMGMWPVPAGTSVMYQFWSGFYIVLISIVTSNWLRKENCHVHWCPRTGRYPAADGAYHVCKHHHPDETVRHGKVTFEHILHAHRNSKGMNP